jgi:hypothetical protein
MAATTAAAVSFGAGAASAEGAAGSCACAASAGAVCRGAAACATSGRPQDTQNRTLPWFWLPHWGQATTSAVGAGSALLGKRTSGADGRTALGWGWRAAPSGALAVTGA